MVCTKCSNSLASCAHMWKHLGGDMSRNVCCSIDRILQPGCLVHRLVGGVPATDLPPPTPAISTNRDQHKASQELDNPEYWCLSTTLCRFRDYFDGKSINMKREDWSTKAFCVYNTVQNCGSIWVPRPKIAIFSIFSRFLTILNFQKL